MSGFTIYIIVWVVILLIFVLVGHAAQWLDRQSCQRAQQIERDLAQAEKRLEILALSHAAGLDALAHEARKALILASFRESQEARNDASDEHRC
ncbi:MAG: hypothetical protein ACYCW7_14195 [Pseudomonadaceae bacterium]